MQLPSAGVAAPRPVVPGSSPVPQPGAAAGFEAVMNGLLASGSKTSDGTAQQAPDGGAQEKPADDGSGTTARAAKPEASKGAKDTVDAAGSPGAPGAVVAGGAAVAGGLAMAVVAPGTAAPQASRSGIAVLVMDGTVPAKAIAGTSAAASLVGGMSAPTVPVAPPLGSPGQSPTQPGSAPSNPLPAGPQPAGTLPPSPIPGNSSLTNPLPANPEPGVSMAAVPARESGTAVVLPVGKPATQQDTQAAAAPGLPTGIQAGIPVMGQPASPLQQASSTAVPGMVTPTFQSDPAKLLPQVSGPLFSLASAAPGSHVMTLKLSPENLGPLTVRAHIEGAGVRIELFAPGEAGREAVRSILPELRRGLGESGFGASLDLSEHNAPADAGAGGSDPGERRPAESPAFPRSSDGDTVRLPRTAVVLPRSITSSLDILV
ncbi:flagellar hook-length control protein FliK [Arthrobacter sp. efr-133-R2A-120]|uniref:flagellar hook-length control protein FliK n=1 Tax=Arthrobacter sp. efr-133-R2A-120 TaxID=3040277 RepID=UPI00254E967E|nr:flagellar hook-length control protein FliK [Arthrobacter sp. efr-133-R2A-120]